MQTASACASGDKRLRRVAVGLVLGAMLFAFAPPARAIQSGISASLKGVTDRTVVKNTIPITAEASATAGVRKLTLFIDGDIVAEVTPSGVRQNVDTSFDWDTTHYVTSPQLARNRTYILRVRAVANGGAEDEVTVTVIADNAPSTPTGLAGSASGGKVNLTWDASPEPDILGYRVERFYGNEYVKARFVTEPAFSERRPAGRYSYRIVAVRHSEMNRRGIASEPSAVATLAVSKAAASSNAGAGSGGKARGKNAPGAVRHNVSRRIGAGGLPAGAALPSSPGMSGLPSVPEAARPWGSYEKRLPYKLPRGGVPVQARPAGNPLTATLRVIPPDGLRWVAAGLLLLVTAALSRLIAMRLQAQPAPAKIEA